MVIGWGTGPWGAGGPWSGTATLPTLIDVSPNNLEIEGGTILTIVGLDFFPEFIPQVLTGPPGGPYTIEDVGYLFDPVFDLTPTRALAGMPALAFGTYHLRVSTPAGLSGVLENVLLYKPFADEVKAQKGRSGWAPKWKTGFRLGA